MYCLNDLLLQVPNGNNSLLHLRQNHESSFPLRYWLSIKLRLLHLICTHKLHLSQYIELPLSRITLVHNMGKLLPLTKKKILVVYHSIFIFNIQLAVTYK